MRQRPQRQDPAEVVASGTCVELDASSGYRDVVSSWWLAGAVVLGTGDIVMQGQGVYLIDRGIIPDQLWDVNGSGARGVGLRIFRAG